MKHLLQVQDTFQVTGRGLVVVPDIPVAPGLQTSPIRLWSSPQIPSHFKPLQISF